MDSSTRYQFDADVTFQKLEDATVIVHLGTGRIHHTKNATASRIWELLNEGRSVEEMLAVLGQEFEAPPEQLRREVAEFLGLLAEENMIAPTGAAA